nr:MAG TPA: hypothetical protein [Caudoviricetes sp.]
MSGITTNRLGAFYSLSPAGLYSILTNHRKSVYLRL